MTAVVHAVIGWWQSLAPDDQALLGALAVLLPVVAGMVFAE